MLTMANLQNDLGNALETTLNAAGTRFPVGQTGATYHFEYAPQEHDYNGGATGKCLIRPLPVESVAGTNYDESCQSIFGFELRFELVDVFGQSNAQAVCYAGLHSTFRDRGYDFWANVTDNGSNLPGGKTGVLTVGDIVEQDSDDSDRPTLVARVSVRCWHKIPMA